MKYLTGLSDYLEENYHLSVFDKAESSDEQWGLHIHDHLFINTKILKDERYEVEIEKDKFEEPLLHKTKIKFLYPQNINDKVLPLIKSDKKIKNKKLEPILAPAKRFHIKNKSLFPLMREKRVVFFTMLEGEILRGIIDSFTRYDITLKLKGGLPVYILRHAILDLRDKKGRCFLKLKQDKLRDWQRSSLYSSDPLSS